MSISMRISKNFAFFLCLCLCSCRHSVHDPVKTCWHKHKPVSEHFMLYVNYVLTEHKHKKKAYAHAYVAAILTGAYKASSSSYACVASEDRA